MTQSDTHQFDDGLIGSDTGDSVVGAGHTEPWRLDDVRIDGIEPPIPAFQAGAEATLSAVFFPLEGAADHIQRWKAIRDYQRWAADVTTYQSAGRGYYREQHGGVDGYQLALLAPLAKSATGYAPEPRSSVYEPMWVVVTDVSGASVRPEVAAELDITVTLIARRSEYATRQAVRHAFERTGFGV